MLKLPNVTIAALACTHIEETVRAFKYSMQDIEFADAVLASHIRPDNLPENIRFQYTPQNKTIDDFNYKMIYGMHKYIQTDFMLLIHYDGFVINPQSWRDDFLNYDYIGAPWPKNKKLLDAGGNICRVGNSVSLRSKRLMELPAKLNLPFKALDFEPYKNMTNEDLIICVQNKHTFEKNDMRFAPLEIAKYFSHEANIAEIQGIKPFAFHGYFGENKNNAKLIALL